MGYTTEFEGQLNFDKELTEEQMKIIQEFSETRHGGNMWHDSDKPGLWCDWTVDETSLFWNGSEKFYSYVKWLEYLIRRFFKPWDIKLNGEIKWQGEDRLDIGIIIAEDNVVSVKCGTIHYE